MSDPIHTVEAAKVALDKWIAENRLPPGCKLPSERELCDVLKVKRMTLRQALLSLESDSCIFRKDRRGWFMTPARFIYNPNSSSSFRISAEEQGRVPSWGYLAKTQIYEYDERLADIFFNGESEAVYQITGWGALDDHKVFYHETYINPEYAPDFIEYIGNESLQSLWLTRFAQNVKTKHLTFRPIRMNGDVCKHLGCAPGSPAILVEKHRANANDVVVHIDIEYWRFETVDFVINL
ncbi:GntR family transcriptional regulator [Aeromonas finlandensis]|uniref:GntR family transcriptional regulator n=1 Tax=Aeromonas finlandensis TaxID=1543375 RepID=UPI00051BA051|nr:GntR family transcriptional regulator [Aeromonas finlandensis]